MLQARAGKRMPLAALRIAHDLVAEKIIPPGAALKLLEGLDLDAIEAVELSPPPVPRRSLAAYRRAPASRLAGPCSDTGRVDEFKRQGKPVVLLREHTETADIEALSKTEALVTAHGARTSHAAVVARQLGKVCLVGCHLLKIDVGPAQRLFRCRSDPRRRCL